MPRPEDQGPPFPPSYTLHVSPAQSDGCGNFASGDFLALQGYSLKDAIGFLYDFNLIRIQIPTLLDNGKRYDFALVLPEQESSQRMKDRMREGLEDYFHVNVIRDSGVFDVYVLTVAEDGKLEAVRRRTNEGMGTYGSSSVSYVTRVGLDGVLAGTKAQPIDTIRGVSSSGTVDEFCRTLESMLDHPVVNETNIQGESALHVESSGGPENNFREQLREQLGLVIISAQRTIEILLLEPR